MNQMSDKSIHKTMMWINIGVVISSIYFVSVGFLPWSLVGLYSAFWTWYHYNQI